MQSDDILKSELKQALSECDRLRDENARLRLRLSGLRISVLHALSGCRRTLRNHIYQKL